jgi:signal transduction histidine kinase
VWAVWIVLGLLIGFVCAAPILRVLLHRAERRARAAERRALDAERLAELGSMTAGLAHEIKNPLSTIGLNAQLLAEGINDAEMSETERERLLRRLDALSREGERLRAILTDFLEFAGRVKLDAQPRDLVRIVTELRDFFHPQCDQNRIVLRTSLPDEPVAAQVDESLFKQAMLNLMINATQAMSDGGLESTDRGAGPRGELILQVEADDDEARVHVIDTGPGIEPDRLERIFHPYVSHTTGGTGLGLSTARRIIEEHGGSLAAHSEVGRGSDFVIHLPRRRGASVPS